MTLNKINMLAAKFGERIEFNIYDNLFTDFDLDEFMEELKRYAAHDVIEVPCDYGEGYSYWQAALYANHATREVKVWRITIRGNSFYKKRPGET